MKTIITVAALTLACGTMPIGAQTPSIDDLRFMAGCWRGQPDARNTVIEEHYTGPSANLMLGTTRYLRDGRTSAFEFSRIHATRDSVFIVPAPNGNASVSFRLVESTETRAVFENRAHDFPNRIIYVRDGDVLTARIEGNDGQGTSWAMAPVRCDAPAP